MRRWPCRFTNVPSASRRPRPFGLAAAIAGFLGTDIPIGIDCYDGSSARSARHAAPASSSARRRPLRYVLTAPGELGFARAYVAGEIDVEGDIFEALALRDHLPDVKVDAARVARCWRAPTGRRRAPAVAAAARGGAGARPPPQQGTRRGRDRAPLRRVERLLPHRARPVDDVLVRGVRRRRHARSKPRRRPSTSSCAASSVSRPGMRLLDVGCGWGGMVMHAAREHGVHAVGVTLVDAVRRSGHAPRCARPGSPTASRSGCRTTATSPTARSTRSARSGCSSTSAWRSSTSTSRVCSRSLRPQAAVAQSRHRQTAGPASRVRAPWVHRPVRVPRRRAARGRRRSCRGCSAPGSRCATSRDCASTTRRRCGTGSRTSRRTGTKRCDSSGAGRARVWRLYMAASACNFDAERNQIHQVLAVRNDSERPERHAAPARLGASGLELVVQLFFSSWPPNCLRIADSILFV